MIGRNLDLILYCGTDTNWIECQAYLLQKQMGPVPSLVRSKRNLNEDFNKIGQTINYSKFVKAKSFKFKGK